MSLEGNAKATYKLRGKLGGVLSNVIDNTLSIEGAAADAKATGDAIKGHSEDKNNPHGVTAAQVGARPSDWMPTAADVGARSDTWLPSLSDIKAAPSGYGYGEPVPLINYESADDLLAAVDAILLTMHQNTSKQIEICCNELFRYGFTFFCSLTQYWKGYATLEGVTYDGNRFILYKQDYVWREVEWKNPPMWIGEEYRTTERFNNNIVYTKLIDCGYLPNASTKTVSLGLNGLCRPIRYCGYAEVATGRDPIALPGLINGQTLVEITNWNIILKTDGDYSAQKAYVQIWYYK